MNEPDTSSESASEAVIEEARQMIRDGKTQQPRRLLEAALSDHPSDVLCRIALVEVALREGDFERAIREGRETASLAMIQCKEAGVTAGQYSENRQGRLFLLALRTTARAYRSAGEQNEAVNTYAAILQEDPADSLAVCTELIELFLELGKPEGVLGLYRLGFTHGLNLLDVLNAALQMGDLAATYLVLVDALELVPETRVIVQGLDAQDPVQEDLAASYLKSRKEMWRSALHRRTLQRALSHPIVHRTLELVDEMNAAQEVEDAQEIRKELFRRLRADEVTRSVVESLRS